MKIYNTSIFHDKTSNIFALYICGLIVVFIPKCLVKAVQDDISVYDCVKNLTENIYSLTTRLFIDRVDQPNQLV